MKSLLIGLIIIFVSFIAYGQEALNSIGQFGEEITTSGAISAKKLPKRLKDGESEEFKVKGTIKEVCQAKGCWMTLDLGNNELMRVKFKDYGFFVPKDAAGKTAIIQGVAKKEIVDVDELKHLAEDAGKSENEINSIKEPKVELTFVASGVIIK